MTYTDNTNNYASKEHPYSPQTSNGYNNNGETGDYSQLNYNDDEYIDSKNTNDINNYGHVRQEWYNDMAYYWHIPNPAFPASFYGVFPTPPLSSMSLSPSTLMYYPPPLSSAGEVKEDDSFTHENDDNNGSYLMMSYNRFPFYSERRFIELPCGEYEDSQLHANHRPANYNNTDAMSPRNYHSDGGNVPFGNSYRYYNDNFSRRKSPPGYSGGGLRHNRNLNSNWRRNFRGSNSNTFRNSNNYTNKKNYKSYYNDYYDSLPNKFNNYNDDDDSSESSLEEINLKISKQIPVIPSSITIFSTPPASASSSVGFEKLPVDILIIIVQYAFPDPTSSCLTNLRLLSKSFNKAILSVLREYIKQQLNHRYNIKPNFKCTERAENSTRDTLTKKDDGDPNDDDKDKEHNDDSNDYVDDDGMYVIPQFLSLARPQTLKKVVCILCGYASSYAMSCPPRDRNGCGRMCFNCYKPIIYNLLDSRVNFKTIQELSVFRNRFFDSMGKLEWFDAIPWNHDYGKNNKLVRWITFNRMKDYVEKYYQRNGMSTMTLTVTKQAIWSVVENSPKNINRQALS
ncbi:11744_t:CDS:2 [Ambispora leptoticha]|uniref:11744_t:CDS:1 n=1 Tax=Ambispora leptoticha TaxID=144679 RepID=A0A9N8ZJE2_9GLOM|nr:11744_t:CDS:2 [Ambispora leptoticha]